MDQVRIGKFIAKVRKSKKLTQEELGSKLGISGKAVSKWERGINLPDYTNLVLLADILEISINELISGNYIKEHNFKGLNSSFINGVKYYRKKYVIKSIIISSIIIVLSIVLIFFINNYNKNQVYLISCNDNDIKCTGYLMYNQQQNILFVDHLSLSNNSKNKYNHINLQLLNNNKSFFNQTKDFDSLLTPEMIIKELSIVYSEEKIDKVNWFNYQNKLNDISIKLILYDDKGNDFIYQIPLKFTNIFKNNKLIY